MTQIREVKKWIRGQMTSDGAGVSLRRLIASHELDMLDPFLLFDAFGSSNPDDYIAGFPPHPHRGFETVTYMLAGKMRHEDSAGNAGVIETGGVQWMTAGKGIIHSEKPEQEQGLLAGFQLWVNLPASQKMIAPRYQEMPAKDIPEEIHDDGLQIRVVAGETKQGTQGVIDNSFIEPVYFVVNAPVGSVLNEQVPASHNGFVYVAKGRVQIGSREASVPERSLAVLAEGDSVQIRAEEDSIYIVVAGKPLNEPVERAGPFVMNTRAQLEQAFDDYRNGRFA
ncbi:pirin family protein [Methylophaga sp. OBS3]|uniref:pirin family protein n=1 Tax=Methylophaga sp. OBS3 TaxID=2991934 RepID=UPI0022500F4D|nr:pirin family protein [Methylophaga sp. OBS3]MCX4189047.1 pirin family protein [Methylophaga sp. OBS3]